uniref:Olfactory receptor n=1 Tax=Chelydra serpentina TaxID=8475 RepID=A0A8C3SDY1_CHESE
VELMNVTEFLLLGFSSHPRLQTVLFAAGLLIYLLTMLGNLMIIALVRMDRCLHTPMYFLLGNLSFTEICYISSTMPKMLWNLLSGDKAISFTGCLLQMYFFVALGGTECVLLSAMAYDRYAAICHPLRYILLMRRRVCAWLLGASWVIGHLNSIINTSMVFSLSFCGTVEIHHFFCDIPPLLRLSCSDTSLSQLVTFSVSGCVIILPFCLTLLSYLIILSSILKIRTARGKLKAFSTCSSHLAMVSIFYGTVIFTYMRPVASHSPEQDPLVSVLYGIVTPMLNPFIYSFRNKEVQGALQRALGRSREQNG